MSEPAVKACADCVHCQKDPMDAQDSDRWTCEKVILVKAYTDLITGLFCPGVYRSCFAVRYDVSRCGKSGVWWKKA